MFYVLLFFLAICFFLVPCSVDFASVSISSIFICTRERQQIKVKFGRVSANATAQSTGIFFSCFLLIFRCIFTDLIYECIGKKKTFLLIYDFGFVSVLLQILFSSLPISACAYDKTYSTLYTSVSTFRVAPCFDTALRNI